MDGTVLWITGLPGSGKSTITEAVRRRHPGFIILRMDDLRKVVTPRPSYADAERDIVYRSLVYLAKILSSLGHDVIIDATGNLRQWRDLAREQIPSFAEVFLTCSLDLCRKREAERTETHGAPKDIYRKGREGWPVPGVSVPYEEPLAPEITIDTGTMPIEEGIALITAYLNQHASGNRRSG